MKDASDFSARHTYGTWRYQRGWKPVHVVGAEGCWFTDAAGKRYLDFSSQLVSCTLGHGNRAVIDAIAEQARTLAFIGPQFTTTARAELSRLLLDVLPKGLTKFFFTTSGTEANEAAIRIARLYTGRHKILSRYTSYHGSTGGSIAATGDFRRWPVEPVGKIDGVIFGPECNCYRCPLGREHPGCAVACADYLEYMITHDSNVAAVIVEPIVGTNGVLVPPPEYLPRLAAIAKKHGVLLIADEVMTGWGRTGAWFAVNHWGVRPDILTTAKGITASYVPLGLTATTEEIAAHFDDHYFPLGHTYEAHPITLGPAVATIREYQKHGLIERSAAMGKLLGKKLSALQKKHACIGDVRGLGLFWALDLVRDRKTKEPFNTPQDRLDRKPMAIDQITAKLMSKGVFVLGWISHLVLAPPLIVSEEELEIGVRAIDEALGELREQHER